MEPQGQAVYDKWCSHCHGPEQQENAGTVALQAKYQGSLPADLLQRKDLTEEVISFYVRNGVSVMPFFRKTEISDKELTFYTELDYVNHFALVAFIKADDHNVPVGGCRYIALSESDDNRCAEVAFAVIDAYQGLGVATLLFKHLLKVARMKGIKEFVADVLVENKGMRKIFEKSGLPIRSNTEDSVMHIFLTLV